jgi:AcrR family transcriptional regulator
MPRTRAVSPSQKDARRTAILHAAGELFQNAPYDHILMQQVAERAGLAKGTLFLYFETKEHLFLALTVEALNRWLSDLCADLRASTPPLMTLAFTRLVERSLRRQPAPGGQSTLLRLLSLHPHRLSELLDPGTRSDLTRSLQSSLNSTAELIEYCLPYLQPGQGEALLRRIIAFLIGLPGSLSLTPAKEGTPDSFSELAAVLNLQLYALETLHRRKSAG